MRDEPYKGEGGIQVAYAAAEQGLRPEIPFFCPGRFAGRFYRDLFFVSYCPHLHDHCSRSFVHVHHDHNKFFTTDFFTKICAS